MVSKCLPEDASSKQHCGFPVIPLGTARFPFPWLSGLPGRSLLIHLRHKKLYLKQVPLCSPFLRVSVTAEFSLTQTFPLGRPGGWQQKPVVPFLQMQEECGGPSSAEAERLAESIE